MKAPDSCKQVYKCEIWSFGHFPSLVARCDRGTSDLSFGVQPNCYIGDFVEHPNYPGFDTSFLNHRFQESELSCLLLKGPPEFENFPQAFASVKGSSTESQRRRLPRFLFAAEYCARICIRSSSPIDSNLATISCDHLPVRFI